jgi:rod shape-determining protein MreD
MAANAKSRRLPVIAALLVALALSIQPLPDWLTPYRPAWVAMIVFYWCMNLPRDFALTIAFGCGLLLDVLSGTPLGQHALALVVAAYLPLKLYLRLAVFPVWQLTLVVLVYLSIYEFVLFWSSGVIGTAAPLPFYWGPLVSSIVIWPLILAALDTLRFAGQVKS